MDKTGPYISSFMSSIQYRCDGKWECARVTVEKCWRVEGENGKPNYQVQGKITYLPRKDGDTEWKESPVDFSGHVHEGGLHLIAVPGDREEPLCTSLPLIFNGVRLDGSRAYRGSFLADNDDAGGKWQGLGLLLESLRFMR